MMTNELTLEDINHIALRNVNDVLSDFEDRISYLEEMHNQACSAAADERERSAVSANGFDLERYRGLLEKRIYNLKRSAEETYGKITYERYTIQIEAYEHAIRLLDA